MMRRWLRVRNVVIAAIVLIVLPVLALILLAEDEPMETWWDPLGVGDHAQTR